MQDCRWDALAEKLIDDIRQLEKINSTIDSSNGRPCKIMINIENTIGKFFKWLDGAEDYELSKDALRKEKERCESPSASSSTTSQSPVDWEDLGDLAKPLKVVSRCKTV